MRRCPRTSTPVLRDLPRPRHSEHHRRGAGLGGQVLLAGVPAGHQEGLVQHRLEQQRQPLNYYNSDIASLWAIGGDVIPTFGGYSADQSGTEIADSCTNVSQSAAA